ncbi:hypothetical protein GFS31_07520 [Leptolyngbya sp. BL0902]|uniref:UPF0182 family protein n=1 Tax=Leptolyngbya sp. BL0902 TaxID=1115757 RepID=UPI0018E6EA09|nr:UPF0182 family protein [Leptolyngbya sp. BL0902]QQE64079.1 hypothetical protein GFS31_07520 [Leptolyngbya sp. BL0902]
MLKDAKHWLSAYWPWCVLSIAGLLTVDAGIRLLAEHLWFVEVNYVEVFWLRLRSQLLLGLVPIGLTLLFTWGNLALADRTTPLPPPPERASKTQGLDLRGVLLLSGLLSFLVGLQVVYQGQLVANFWRETTTLYQSSSPLPLWPTLQLFWVISEILLTQPWLIGALGISTVAFVVYPRQLGRLAAGLMSLGCGLILAQQWPTVLLAFDPVAFNETEPIFKRDIGFYIFQLPLLNLVEFWLIGILFFTFVVVCLVYLLRGGTLSRGRFYGFSASQQQHLYTLAGLLFVITSFSHWLGRYDILYSQEGVVYGAGYTHVHVLLPVNGVLMLLTLGLGLVFLWRGLLWRPSYFNPLGKVSRRQSRIWGWFDLGCTSLLVNGISLYLVLALVGLVLAPAVVQRLVVQPNELQRERPYITNSIALTRAAFDLEAIDSEPFDPSGDLTVEDLERNDLTLENIRLWDTRPLLESNRQLQQIRLYYEFKDADFDRYSILNQERRSERRQVMISARELNYERVPDIAKTWVNEHLVYTHGFGFTLSPVNTAGPDGLPVYFVRGIENIPSSEEVRQSIPIGDPRLYFGELTDTYIMTNTKVLELDYPSGNENIYTTYLGRGGIPLDGPWRRLLFARYLKDWRMLFTEDFTPDTRLLFRRNIAERVRTIAPFLRFDTDPYLVTVDIGGQSRQWGTGIAHGSAPPEQVDLQAFRDRDPSFIQSNFNTQTGENYLYWIIDAYTVSSRYPYSDPGDKTFNYIRNSVKVVVDAFNGSVSFFVAEPDDPIIQAWSGLLPGMFEPLTAMPEDLHAHIRYPQDLFSVQADALMTYHMTDPQVFYNREDQWRAPTEIYASETQQVEPYYLIMKLPEEDNEEFILLRLFTPAQRNNLVAWLAARSDGDRYGRRLLYRFPKQELVFGPEQIEARINQDPEISQRISLWDTQGSRAQQGNLLVIPIEQSLLYVEPLYLVAEQNQLPTLTRVIMVYRNRIAMAPTLADVLSAIFLEEPPPTLPILRELEEELPDNVLPASPSEGDDAGALSVELLSANGSLAPTAQPR